MAKINKIPKTPADALIQLLDAYQLTQSQAAKDMQMNLSSLRTIAIGKSKIGLATATRLAKYFNTPVQYWMDLQAACDAEELKKDNKFQQIIKSIPKAKKPKEPKPAKQAKADASTPKAKRGAGAKAPDKPAKPAKAPKGAPQKKPAGAPKKDAKAAVKPAKEPSPKKTAVVKRSRAPKKAQSAPASTPDAGEKKPHSILIKKAKAPAAPKTTSDVSPTTKSDLPTQQPPLDFNLDN
jgi:addiction module HigA family antidote